MGNEAYNQGLKAAIDLEEATDYIDRIYSAKILGLYGLGLALTMSTAEFDQLMSLTPKPPPGTDSLFLEVFIKVLEHVPIAGDAYEAAKIAGETAHHIAEVLQKAKAAADALAEASKHFQEDGKQVDSLEPDEDAMKIIRSRSVKLPLFQNLLSARYQVEYERRAARERLRRELRTSLEKRTFQGRPVDLARRLFGNAPRDLRPQEVYQQFAKVQKDLLRELIRNYVRKYVTVELWIEHSVTGDRSRDWIITVGLNQPQWDYIYARFGFKADKRILALRNLHSAAVFVYLLAQAAGVEKIAGVMGIQVGRVAFSEPILAGVEDLWRFWGAKLRLTEHWWYGKSGPFYKSIDANPVR